MQILFSLQQLEQLKQLCSRSKATRAHARSEQGQRDHAHWVGLLRGETKFLALLCAMEPHLEQTQARLKAWKKEHAKREMAWPRARRGALPRGDLLVEADTGLQRPIARGMHEQLLACTYDWRQAQPRA